MCQGETFDECLSIAPRGEPPYQTCHRFWERCRISGGFSHDSFLTFRKGHIDQAGLWNIDAPDRLV